jgi:hypothetical protein
MGAPRTGLLSAMRSAWLYSTVEDESASLAPVHPTILTAKVFVVDTGISDAWGSYGESLGLNPGPVVDFGYHWYIQLRVDELSKHVDQTDEVDSDGNDDDDE